MRPLSGVAVILTLLTDLSSGLHAVTGSSCFSDRNIWDFLSAQTAVSWYISPVLQREPTVSDTKAVKKNPTTLKCANGKSTTWYWMTQLCRFRIFQVEYILVYLRSKRPQTLSLSDWVSCSCRFTKAQQLQIFICLPEVPLPADQSFLWRIIGRQWKLSLGNLFLGQESDSSVRLLQWPLTLVCHMQHNNMSKRGVMCISCNIWEKQNKLWRNKPSQVWFLGHHYRKNIFQSLKWDFTHNPEYRGKEKVIRGYTRIHLNSCLIHPKRSIWLHPNAPRLSAIALHMVNISHRGAGVPQMLLSYGCLAAA